MKKIRTTQVLVMKRRSIYNLFKTAILLLFFHLQQNLFAQNSQFNQPYYWGESNYSYYVLDKNIIHDHVSPYIDLYGQPYNGAIVYVDQNTLLSFIVDPFWERIVYANYHDVWIKSYGVYGTSIGQFKHPRGITTDGLGNICIADTYNGRIVNLEYDSGNNVIDAGSFSTIGEGILQRPWDLDIDDKGNLEPSDDIIWVVDNGINQIVPFNLSGTIVSNGPITHLYNSSTGTTYWDLSGLCGVAVRKSAAQGYNSTSNRRLYLVDWKLRKLFLVEAEALEDGQGLVYKEKTFGSDVLLSGVESDYFGDVWVVDNANNKIYKYTWDLQYLDELSGLNRPTSIASVRRHNENMAITERWTNTTGNRTYSHGADIKNININTSTTVANFDFRLTNYCYLEAKVYKDSNIQTTLEDGTNVSPSGNMAYNWYKENPSGVYTLKLWAKAYHDQTIYRFRSQHFTFSLTANISGPMELGYKELGTWTAQTTGGNNTITYEWYLKFEGDDTWYLKSTNQSYSRTMLNDSFTLKLIAYSNGESAEDTHTVEYLGDGGEGGKFPKETANIPSHYGLSQNYPNPFNPFTNIKYELPEASKVIIAVYNLYGTEVIQWKLNDIPAGYHQIIWYGTNQYGVPLSSGIYLYRLMAKSTVSDKNYSKTLKMVLIK